MNLSPLAVDGNDPIAVYLACVEARERAIEGQKPVLIEVRSLLVPRPNLQPPLIDLDAALASQALSYRVGHHSTYG